MPEPGASPHATEIVTVGESMIAFTCADEREGLYRAAVIGAESNVALNLAQLGHRVAWVSRVGVDEMGDLMVRRLALGGVEVLADRDPRRPTAVALKELVPGQRAAVRYYRTGSAAAGLDGTEVRSFPASARWIHLTGITPALSDSANGAVERYLRWARERDVRVSFDVNYRPVLWADRERAAATLLRLCRASTLVFVGDDEAEALFGHTSGQALVDELRLRPDQQLVIKRGAAGAEAWSAGGERVFEAALDGVATDATGAGDAFAAGYLSATMRDAPVPSRLQMGHLLAAQAIATWQDVGPPPDMAAASAILAGSVDPDQEPAGEPIRRARPTDHLLHLGEPADGQRGR